MQTPRFLFSSSLLLAGVLAIAPLSHAVVLEQKWRAGEKLSYQTQLSGNVNLQISRDVPFLLAGVPLDIEVQGNGQTQLETLRVDDSGTGTVAVKMPTFDFTAQTFGQAMKMTLREGKSRVTLNGRAVPWGQGLGERVARNNAALKIGRDGRIVGIERLTAPKNEASPEAVAPEKAIDQTAFITSLLVRSLPAFLPQGDVTTGADWKASIEFPAIARTDASGKTLPLGEFQLHLAGEDTVNDQKLWRIAVKGQIEIDGAKIPADEIKKTVTPQLQSAKQTVEGDLWFDAARGQFVRAELILGSNASSRLPDKNGQLGEEPSWFDFTGTLRFNLDQNA